MSSKEYWEKRKAQRMWEYMEEAEKAADQISIAYEKAESYLEKEIDKIYMRYKSKHGLSELEARQMLHRMYDKTSFEEFHSMLKQAKGEDKKELLAVIEAPAYASRIAQLQETQERIDGMMRSIYRQEFTKSKRHYADLADEVYYKTIYDMQKDVGIAFSFSEISRKQIDRLLKSKWSGINYSKRIWNNTQNLAEALKQELLVGLMTGKSDREVCEIIRHRFASGAMEARRLVRTESCYIANEMEGQAYEESGIDRYIFVATLDKKTSKVCQELDHKVFAVKDRKPGVNCPPMHPWCRSTTIACLDDNVLKDMTRKARDPETGKIYSVPANLSYSDWYDRFVENDTKKVNAVKTYKNKHFDLEQYKRYKAIFKDESSFETFDKFQSMKYNDIEKWDTFKSKKQDTINTMDFEEMDDLIETLSNREARMWYKAHDENIPSIIDKNLSIEDQAKQACELRNTYRTQARKLMSDQKLRKELDANNPNKTFDELLESKMQIKGLTREQVIMDIYKTATKTNKKVNKKLGLE